MLGVRAESWVRLSVSGKGNSMCWDGVAGEAGQGLQWFCMEGAQRAKNLDSLPEGSGEDSKLDSIRFATRKSLWLP